MSETPTVTAEALAPPREEGLLKLSLRLTWWIWLFPLALVAATLSQNLFFLDYVHVMSAILWTGADLFLGFLIGPIMRRLEPPVRKKMTENLLPRTLLFMPIMSATTTTAGYYLGVWLKYASPSSPNHILFVVAGIFAIILFVQGLGFILPANLKVYWEIKKPQPDFQRVKKLMNRYLYLVASQAVFQFLIILVMARLAFH